jgi:hypothetical protein
MKVKTNVKAGRSEEEVLIPPHGFVPGDPEPPGNTNG